MIQNDSKWSQNFDQKGIISITCPDSDSFTDATEKELLSKLEAETLHRDIDAEGLKYWKVGIILISFIQEIYNKISLCIKDFGC